MGFTAELTKSDIPIAQIWKGHLRRLDLPDQTALLAHFEHSQAGRVFPGYSQ